MPSQGLSRRPAYRLYFIYDTVGGGGEDFRRSSFSAPSLPLQ